MDEFGHSFNSGPQDTSDDRNDYSPYGNPAPGGSKRPPASSGMVTASLILGVCSILFLCCGGSFILGATGITLALLSRGSGPMSPNAKGALILSTIGFVLGLLVLLGSLFFMLNSDIQTRIRQQIIYDYELPNNEFEDDIWEEFGNDDGSFSPFTVPQEPAAGTPI